MKPIIVCLASQKTEDEFWKTVPGKALNKFLTLGDIDSVEGVFENNRGLSEIYNECLDAHPDKICLFVHDDVQIWDIFLSEKLHIGHASRKILGIAGTTKLQFDENFPSAWHLLSEKGSGSGFAFHQNPGDRWLTVFGPSPRDCVLVDGLFISVLNDQKFRDSGVRFDEEFKFHHYDMAFCARAKQAGVKISTVDVVCLHGSTGSSMYSDEWKSNDARFREKYYSSLK